MLNFSAVVKHHADLNPNKVALIFQDSRIIYREFNQVINAISKSLLDIGMRNGDVVSLLLYNCPEFLETILATNRIGAIFLPLNYRLAGEELSFILNDSKTTTLITEEEFHSSVNSIRSSVTTLRNYLTVGQAQSSDWRSLNSLIKPNMGFEIPDFEVGLEDLHRLMYTSGTTAHPKGAMITYGNLYWKNIAHIIELSLTKDDVYLVTGPLYHAGALDLSSTSILHVGGTLVILRKFDAEQVLECIQREKVTATWLAPSMLNILLNHPQMSAYNLTSVRLIIDGGEKMPEPLIRKLLVLFPNAWFADAYGLTETVSGDTFLDRKSTINKLGSVGKPVMHLQLRLVDENGKDVPKGEVGEIILKGPKVFKGYWNNPEASAAAFRDGWFCSGDIGRMDEEGYLYIVDRKKDMIKSGGENIASLEVERVLYEYPSISEVAVVGIPDERWGEIPIAYVVLRKGHNASQQELMEFCSKKLARFKIPKKILVVDGFPRNPSGKVLKRLLREQAIKALLAS